MQKLTSDEFKNSRREKLLSYEIYEYNFDDMMDGFQIVRETLSHPDYTSGSSGKFDATQPLEQRAWDGLTFMLTAYSGGNAIEEISSIYPAVLDYWGEYLEAWRAFQQSDESTSGSVAAIPLQGTEYAYANQLLCFAILLGWGSLVCRILPLVDFNNPRRDGMLERLLSFYVRDRGDPPQECTRHLPYFKTIKIFAAAKEERATLMKEYLTDWYEASRREGYYNSHKRGDVFTGYWSWEAAAITFLLDIDDGSYRDMMFYPADLVDYARSVNAPKSLLDPNSEPELREKSGQICPLGGMWESLDIPPQRKKFEKGDVMQAADAAYGITVWRYLGTA